MIDWQKRLKRRKKGALDPVGGKTTGGRWKAKDYASTYYTSPMPLEAVTLRTGELSYATEVISVGVEMIATDPIGFRKEFPEFFEFILHRVVYR